MSAYIGLNSAQAWTSVQAFEPDLSYPEGPQGPCKLLHYSRRSVTPPQIVARRLSKLNCTEFDLPTASPLRTAAADGRNPA